MEQQQLSIEPGQISEGYYLGERYHLGELQGEYYIAYTRADVRRYRLHVFFIVVMIIYNLALITCGILLLMGIITHIFFPFYILPAFTNPFIILYNTSRQRKWGNQPVISPRDRHLRVYIYQYGLVKQTNRKSEFIRWPDLRTIKYQPVQLLDPKQRTAMAVPKAGIKIVLRRNRKMTIHGALRNLDDLAQRLDSKVVPTKTH